MTQKIRIAKNPPAAWTAAKVVGRFVTGRPLDDGQHRTDATWTHRGSKSYGDRRAHWWHYLTKTERVTIRLGAAGGVGTALYGLWTDMSATLPALHNGAVGIGSIGAAWVAYKGTDAALYWRHNRDWVWPLHLVLKEALCLPEGTRPRHYMHIPRAFNEISGDAVRVDLPAAWAGDDGMRSAVTSALGSKLALQDVTYGWQLVSRDHHVVVRATPRPPALVKFSDPQTRALVEKAKESSPIIGLTHSGRVVAVSLDTESPHILVSMSTGGGKSVILRTIAAQFLRNGARVTVLDFKKHSHKWLRGLPGVTYCRTPEEIHDALVRLGAEGERRNEVVEQWDGDDKDAPVGQRELVLFEEANATIRKLKGYWKRIKTSDDPGESPAMEAFGDLLYMGRAVKMHVLLVAQSATANALGGPEIRECFSTRILARYTRNAWMMLVPEAGPPPRKINHVGRCQVVINGTTPKETQVLFFEDAEARDWALSAPSTKAQAGQPTPAGRAQPEFPSGSPQVPSHTGTQAPHPGESAPEPHTHNPAVQPPPDRQYGRFTVIDGGGEVPGQVRDPKAAQQPQYALFEASTNHEKGLALVPMTYNALRTAKKDDPEFPPPDGKRGKSDTYNAETLQRWFRNRPRATGSDI